MRAVVGVVPDERYRQESITEAFAAAVGADGAATRSMLERIHANAGVTTRHLVLPLERYAELSSFREANDEFIRHGVDLGARALGEALARAGLRADDLDLLVTCTVTGLAVPSLDARIAARLRLRDDVRRLPIVGLGCVAGAAGVARIRDHLAGHPGHVAALVCVELCSLTPQRDDLSVANLVASGLFGDGAAAVLMTGADVGAAGDAARPDPSAGPTLRVLDSRSRLYPDTERAMGWDVGDSGLRIALGVEVPELVAGHVGTDVDGFLATHGLRREDIAFWVAHPGGPKVLESLQQALGVDREALALTWRSLAAIGNLSSASVLHVLADTLAIRPPSPGSLGMMLAMGPGFCLEMVLLEAAA